MESKLVAVKGMKDILPDTSANWLYLEKIFLQWLDSYGYQNIRTPIVEESNLFVRSIGSHTDIVAKEMYSFIDSLSGKDLTLRPEGTAGALRCAIEHNLLYNKSQKLWYIGPMFRHENPQKGRYRQFYQLGVEALGLRAPFIDVELIMMVEDLWTRLSINNLQLQINCLGNSNERLAHKNALITFFEKHIDDLDSDSKNRLYNNPLRILDSKNPHIQGIISQAPKLVDYLQGESLAYYTTWKDMLREQCISFVENPCLVRGLDYYNLGVFEWVSQDLGSQATVCAGGRYDPLFEQLGAKPNSGIGLAIGIERLLLILDKLNKLPQAKRPDIYLICVNDDLINEAFKLATNLRVSGGFNVIHDFSNTSLKAQLAKANNMRAKFTIIIALEELLLQQVIIKNMDSKMQRTVLLNDVLSVLNNF